MLHDQSLGTWIKRRRKQLELTQAALADRIGCAEITLRKIEAGTRRPSAVLVQRLIDYLDVPEAERPAIEQLARSSAARPPQRTANVPWPITPLLGRNEELAAVGRLLRDREVRWITVAGPAGVGKTRFALEIARQLQPDFAAGVHVLSLAHVADPALVLPSLARHLAIGAGPQQSFLDALVHGLPNRPLLLVLDNLEQIAAAAADLHTLVRLAPRVTLLITSRVLLGVPGERVVLLDPLPVPEFQPAAPLGHWAAVPAVALFLQRSQAVDPAFALTQDNVADVLAICRRLDGIPLALELAAARSILFSPRHLLDRLQSSLGFLAAGSAAVERRHSSLSVAIQWSYDLLPPPIQRLFRCLAVFVGGWTLEAASAVAASPSQAADIEAGVAALLANSMIVRVPAQGGERRFTMLETLREYAFERLRQAGDDAAVVERHAAYYAGYAEATQTQVNTADPAVWNRLSDEYPNLRAVLAWSIAHERHELAGRLAGSLCWFWWNITNFDEARRWYGAVLVFQGRLSAPVRASVLFGAAKLSGDPVRARPLYEECIALRRGLGDPQAIAEGLIGLGQAATIQGEFARARAAYQEALAYYRACDDGWGVYLALGNLGAVALMERDLRAAEAHIQEIRDLARQMGQRVALIMAQHQSGLLLIVQGRPDAARQVFAANRDQAARFSNARRYVALAEHNLAIIALLGGNVAEAGAYLRSSLRQLSQMADTVNLLAAFECAAAYLLRCGQLAAGRRTWHSVQTLRGELQLLAGAVERACIYPLVATYAPGWQEQSIPFKDGAELLRYLDEWLGLAGAGAAENRG